MKNPLSGLVWVLLYLFFCLAPLVLAVGQSRPPGRPFLVESSAALGFVRLSILALQFALIARFKAVAAPFGIDALSQCHIQITFVALAGLSVWRRRLRLSYERRQGTSRRRSPP